MYCVKFIFVNINLEPSVYYMLKNLLNMLVVLCLGVRIDDYIVKVGSSKVVERVVEGIVNIVLEG